MGWFFYACKFIKTSPFFFELSKLMSRNCLEIYLHVYILQVMKSQLINNKNVYVCMFSYNTRLRTPPTF